MLTKGMSDMSDTIKQDMGASDTIKQDMGDLRNLSGRKKSYVFLDPAGGGNFWTFWDP